MVWLYGKSMQMLKDFQEWTMITVNKENNWKWVARE